MSICISQLLLRLQISIHVLFFRRMAILISWFLGLWLLLLHLRSLCVVWHPSIWLRITFLLLWSLALANLASHCLSISLHSLYFTLCDILFSDIANLHVLPYFNDIEIIFFLLRLLNLWWRWRCLCHFSRCKRFGTTITSCPLSALRLRFLHDGGRRSCWFLLNCTIRIRNIRILIFPNSFTLAQTRWLVIL